MIDGPPTEALRLRSPDALRDGLRRLLVDGEQQWLPDSRDLMVAMAPYHDCATRLGLDRVQVFDDAAREAAQGVAETVRSFGRRTDITPSAFGFTLTTTQAGPAYEWPDFDHNEIRELESWLSNDDETSEP